MAGTLDQSPLAQAVGQYGVPFTRKVILSQHMEKIYIRSMVGRHFTQQGINVPDAKLDVFADLLHTAQLYVREVEVRRRTSI